MIPDSKTRTQMAKRILATVALLGCAQTAWAGDKETMSNSERNAVKKPVIGINVDIEGDKPKEMKVQELYIKAVETAGGIPVMLPPVPAADLPTLLNRLDGVMLIGGRDYDPALYNQKPDPSTYQTDCLRNKFDYSLIGAILNHSDIPLLGICAGSQILNIGLGGDLIQDIHTQNPQSKVQHSSPEGWTKGFNKHIVKLAPDSKLYKIYGKSELNVPTSHHQAVDKLGKGLVAAAHSEDGFIEAVELPQQRFIVGVQWHPERDYEGNAPLFVEFVKQAANHQETNVAIDSKRELVSPAPSAVR
jgi:gamma-glutamyl-gamma-aminobutyrate hydrolase PuuD